jgi:hypothetical protein
MLRGDKGLRISCAWCDSGEEKFELYAKCKDAIGISFGLRLEEITMRKETRKEARF